MLDFCGVFPVSNIMVPFFVRPSCVECPPYRAFVLCFVLNCLRYQASLSVVSMRVCAFSLFVLARVQSLVVGLDCSLSLSLSLSSLSRPFSRDGLCSGSWLFGTVRRSQSCVALCHSVHFRPGHLSSRYPPDGTNIIKWTISNLFV